jgi:hypothetical protein
MTPEQESAKRRTRLLHPRSFDGQADQVVDLDVEQCVEHCFLVRELPVHRADTNAGRESHLVQRGSHSALGEHARRRVKDLATVAFGVGPRGANLLCIDGHVHIAHPKRIRGLRIRSAPPRLKRCAGASGRATPTDAGSSFREARDVR